MKAWVLYGPDDLKYEETSDPVLDPDKDQDKAIIKVKDCGICGSDIPRIFKTGAHRHPLIPGHEFSGEVVDILSDDKGLLGKAAGVFPLIPCGKCPQCRNKKYELCRSYDYLGSRSDGGYGEYVKVPLWNLITLPDNVPFETAAMLEPMAVSIHAIRQAGIDVKKEYKGKKALVIGLGTIGLFISMFLKKLGIEVIGIANKPEPKERFTGFGLDPDNFLLSDDERVKKTSDIFSDVSFVFECTGKNETLETAISLASPESTVVTVGNPASDMGLKKDIYWKILRGQLTLKGTWNSSFTHDEDDDWNRVLKILSDDALNASRMISHRLELKDLMKGLVMMRDKTGYYTKVMVKYGDD